jgi:hypothetical protein
MDRLGEHRSGAVEPDQGRLGESGEEPAADGARADAELEDVLRTPDVGEAAHDPDLLFSQRVSALDPQGPSGHVLGVHPRIRHERHSYTSRPTDRIKAIALLCSTMPGRSR